MRLRMIVSAVVDGARRQVGEVLDIADAEQVTSMLETGTAIPADREALMLWRSGLPAATGWVSGWQR